MPVSLLPAGTMLVDTTSPRVHTERQRIQLIGYDART
jgi:hypothetical protein